MTTAPEPGSLPALRYGDTYSFAARAVDIADNSLPPGRDHGPTRRRR